MRFKDVFSIIGPAMIEPSSSHTAGAVRLGRVGHQLLGAAPSKADLAFFGSFAETYRGHGTDLAVVAGLMGFEPDDPRIPRSFEIAREIGMDVVIRKGRGRCDHPNTVSMRLEKGEEIVRLTGVSIGGGNIEIRQIEDFDVKFGGQYPTLLVFHDDRPGVLAELTRLAAVEGLNIGFMDVDRAERNGAALTAIEFDQDVPERLLREMAALPYVRNVKLIDIREEGSPVS